MRKVITVSKLDAVKRQLETAVHLYFLSRDPISIHTRTAAAYGILKALNKHRSGKNMLMDEIVSAYTKPGFEKEVYRKLHEAENFFKHADRDPESTLEFCPDATEMVLWQGCVKYSELSGEQTPTLQAMNGWVQINHSNWFKFEEWRKQYFSEAAQLTQSIGKEVFYKEFLKLKLNE